MVWMHRTAPVEDVAASQRCSVREWKKRGGGGRGGATDVAARKKKNFVRGWKEILRARRMRPTLMQGGSLVQTCLNLGECLANT